MTPLDRAVSHAAGREATCAPWWAPYHAVAASLGAPPVALPLAAALNASWASPVRLRAGRLRFVPQAELPAGEAYEAFIDRTACVPTRDNLHDLFNGLVWMRFPTLKRHLNELQAAEIARAGVGHTRGRVRDALTLFDENGALLQAPPGLVAALRQRDWQALFVGRRAAWADARLTLFGHALLEKLMAPRKAITAHVWLVPEGADPQAFLLEALTPGLLASQPPLPLPVLGVPGWWPDNEADDFYADPGVFRPLKG